MGKKRAREVDGQTEPAGASADKMDEDSSSGDEDFDMVNVDFEWFNFDAKIDFHGIKGLLRQLFDADAPLLDTSALADAVTANNTVGSAVKVDSKANDAYAFLTALNPRAEAPAQAAAAAAAKKQTSTTTTTTPTPPPPAVAGLVAYLAGRAAASGSAALAAAVPRALREAHVGVVLGERLINMPPEIAPPMYRMLEEEVAAAVEDGEPWAFTHYLVVSKGYHEVRSLLDGGAARGSRKKKKKAKGGDSSSGGGGGGGDAAPPMFYFHPEDEVLQKHAVAAGSYAFMHDDENAADSKRAFQEMGVRSMGYMMLIEAAKWPAAVKAVVEYMSPQ